MRFEGRAAGLRDGEDGLGLLEPLVHLELEPRVFPGEPPPLEHAPDDAGQARQLDRLQDVADRVAFHGLHGGVGGGLPRHDENVRIAALAKGRAHDLDPVHVGEAEIEEHEGHGGGAEAAQGLGTGARDETAVALALETLLERLGDELLVVHDENRLAVRDGHLVRARAGSMAPVWALPVVIGRGRQNRRHPLPICASLLDFRAPDRAV